jgi:hypothetical protein
VEFSREKVNRGMAMRLAVVGRCMVLTEDGLICLMPVEIETGDELLVIGGGQIVHAMRKTGDGDEYTLVGEFYVHGMMDGELVDCMSEENLVKRFLRMK